MALHDAADTIERLRLDLAERTAQLERSQRLRASLVDRLVYAHEDERRLVALELHDQLGQSLHGLLLQIQSGAWDAAAAERRVRALIDDVHRIASGMRPALLDHYGLDSALSHYVGELRRDARPVLDYQYRGPRDGELLPDRVRLTLFRVAQEALTNVLRHAGAQHASVVLIRDPVCVTLIVEDDGRGFDPRLADDESCLGLVGMQERLRLAGGKLDIVSAAGTGTTVRATVPLESQEE